MTPTIMTNHPLRCDGCAAEAGLDGALILVLLADASVKTVRNVRVSCGTCGPSSAPVEDPSSVATFTFQELGDVFDFADRIIPAHDWERGTVQRLSRILVAIHQRARRDG